MSSYKAKKDGEHIARFLPSLVRQKGWEKQLDLHSIFQCWSDLVDEDVHQHARPLKIERGILWLEVESSGWLQQLQYQKLEILDRLNEYLSRGRIDHIKMVLPLKKEKNPYEAGGDSGPAIEFSPPPQDEVAGFRDLISSIGDEACREALMQFWYLANACKPKKK
jgi:hypothetical protein